MDWSRLRWGESSRLLLQAARDISKELGHCEIICPLHLLLGLLANARPESLVIAQPEWDRVLAVMQEFAPPWDDGLMVLSPGGQTPSTKQILEHAAGLAVEAGESVESKHVWAAVNTVESGLVQTVLRRLGLTSEDSRGEPSAGEDRARR